jgi:hypothetical protein
LKDPLKSLKSLIGRSGADVHEERDREADRRMGIAGDRRPAAKQVFGKGLMTGPGLDTAQMNVALGVATGNLNILANAAQSAALALGSQGGGQSAASAAEALAGGAGDATQAMNQQVPVIGQFGSGLLSVLNAIAGGGGGGGGGFMSILKTGLSIAGAAFGKGGFGSLGPSEVTVGGGVLSSRQVVQLISVTSSTVRPMIARRGDRRGRLGRDPAAARGSRAAGV